MDQSLYEGNSRLSSDKFPAAILAASIYSNAHTPRVQRLASVVYRLLEDFLTGTARWKLAFCNTGPSRDCQLGGCRSRILVALPFTYREKRGSMVRCQMCCYLPSQFCSLQGCLDNKCTTFDADVPFAHWHGFRCCGANHGKAGKMPAT